MKVSGSDGSETDYTRPNKNAPWTVTYKYDPTKQDDSVPITMDGYARYSHHRERASMPNISLDYEKIEGTSKRLDDAVTNIVPQLETLRTDVSNLLDDGMVFQQSSPAVRESFNKFNGNLVNAIGGINEFAKQFREIRTQMEQMDTDMAGKIREASNK